MGLGIRNFTSLHKLLLAGLCKCLVSSLESFWMVENQTTNMADMITGKSSDNLEFPKEQKGCRQKE